MLVAAVIAGDSKQKAEDKKQDKRGIFDLGYGYGGGYGGYALDSHGGYGLGGYGDYALGHGLGGLALNGLGSYDHGHVKAITVHKEVSNTSATTPNMDFLSCGS